MWTKQQLLSYSPMLKPSREGQAMEQEVWKSDSPGIQMGFPWGLYLLICEVGFMQGEACGWGICTRYFLWLFNVCTAPSNLPPLLPTVGGEYQEGRGRNFVNLAYSRSRAPCRPLLTHLAKPACPWSSQPSVETGKHTGNCSNNNFRKCSATWERPGAVSFPRAFSC